MVSCVNIYFTPESNTVDRQYIPNEGALAAKKKSL
jgi:hypothetical protein